MNDLLKRYLFKHTNVFLQHNLKKHIFFQIVFSILSVNENFSQNLVPNPSFEFYTECPNSNDNQIIKALPWKGTNLSSDFFHVCAEVENPAAGIPSGTFGQYPKSGEGCAAIIMASNFGISYREYLQVELPETLSANTYYYVKVYINLDIRSKYATNNFGILFTNFSFTTNEITEVPTVANYSPQIVIFNNPIIQYTLEWTKIEGLFLSQADEYILTLGNFFFDSETDTLSNNGMIDVSYYYIDDVSVEEITEPFWQYNDTTIYYGDSVLIGPALTGLDINWYTANDDFLENAPGIYVQPATSRNYIAKETFNGVETTHLVHVTVIGGAGVEENELENVAIFPNPSKGTFYLKGLPIGIEIAKTTVKIYSLSGQCVWSEKLPEDVINNEQEINTTLENGVYVLELQNENGNVETRKIVIQK